MRQRLSALGCSGAARGTSCGTSTSSARSSPRTAVPRWSRPRAAATTARACASCATPAEADDWLAADGRAARRGAGAFRRELAQLVARRPSGEVAAWPLVETVQRDGVCAEVTAPAPGRGDARRRGARTRGHDRRPDSDVTGVLAVELFETADGRLLVNELAMRPHNTGHWSIDGAVTSQFEQHLRAVLDLPLGDPSPRQPWSVMVNVLGGPAGATMPDRYPRRRGRDPDVEVPLLRQGRRAPAAKSGTSRRPATTCDELRARARAAAAFFED